MVLVSSGVSGAGEVVVEGNGRRSNNLSRRRKPPIPNSILDQKALVRALEARGLSVNIRHIEAFYQALHRAHYPDLQSFCEIYDRHERKEWSKVPPVGPLKNSISNRKNRNKMQLPNPFLDFLKDPENGFVTITSRVAQQKTSADGMTTKLAIELHDGQLVESVLMRYLSHDSSRASLCVSSQCGCAMGCTFCATGTMGLSGNLTTGEILEQMVHANRILAKEWDERWKENANTGIGEGQPVAKLDLVRNVVFMGMGEPLDNYTNVVDACRAFINRKRWNLAHGRVTVSTVGLVSQIRRLTQELPEVSLALSLHAPNQAMRSAIVPTASRFPIESLIQALDEHMMIYIKKQKQKSAATGGTSEEGYTVEERQKESTRRRAMIEYVMLEGDTSSFECAHQLGKLCENRHLLVNLIPYNQTDVKDKLRCPSREHMLEFQQIVCSYGTFCTIRRTMGADIASACGQLVTLEQESKETTKSATVGVRDIEDAAATPYSASTSKVVSKKSKNTKAVKIVDGEFTVNEKGSGHPKDLDFWIVPLTLATSVSAVCFAVATTLFLKQARRK